MVCINFNADLTFKPMMLKYICPKQQIVQIVLNYYSSSKNELAYYMGPRKLIVWHPSEPGQKVFVIRSFWQRIFFPAYYALQTEVKDLENN